eukprot:scaffold17736_cov62-Phaeocystis_antarctica.AAC.3
MSRPARVSTAHSMLVCSLRRRARPCAPAPDSGSRRRDPPAEREEEGDDVDDLHHVPDVAEVGHRGPVAPTDLPPGDQLANRILDDEEVHDGVGPYLRARQCGGHVAHAFPQEELEHLERVLRQYRAAWGELELEDARGVEVEVAVIDGEGEHHSAGLLVEPHELFELIDRLIELVDQRVLGDLDVAHVAAAVEDDRAINDARLIGRVGPHGRPILEARPGARGVVPIDVDALDALESLAPLLGTRAVVLGGGEGGVVSAEAQPAALVALAVWEHKGHVLDHVAGEALLEHDGGGQRAALVAHPHLPQPDAAHELIVHHDVALVVDVGVKHARLQHTLRPVPQLLEIGHLHCARPHHPQPWPRGQCRCLAPLSERLCAALCGSARHGGHGRPREVTGRSRGGHGEVTGMAPGCDAPTRAHSASPRRRVWRGVALPSPSERILWTRQAASMKAFSLKSPKASSTKMVSSAWGRGARPGWYGHTYDGPHSRRPHLLRRLVEVEGLRDDALVDARIGHQHEEGGV